MLVLFVSLLLMLIPMSAEMLFHGISALIALFFIASLPRVSKKSRVDDAKQPLIEKSSVVMLQCNLHGINDLMQQPTADTLFAVSALASAISQAMASVENHRGIVDRSCYDRFFCTWQVDEENKTQKSFLAMSCALEIAGIFSDLSLLLAKNGFLPVLPFIAIDVGEGVFATITRDGSDQGMFVSSMSYHCQEMISEARRFGISISVGNRVPGSDVLMLVDIGGSFMALVGKGKAPASQLGQHQKMLSLYGEKRYEAAMVISQSLRTAWNGNLTLYYEWMMERCKMLSRR